MSAPVIDLSAAMRCTAPFRVEGYRYEERPILEKDIGRVGTSVRCEGFGYVMESTPAAFQTSIAALSSYGDGNDFVIYGQQNSVLQAIRASSFVDGGPFCGFEILDQDAGPLYRKVRFTIEGRTIGDYQISAYTVRTAVGPDGLARVTQSGQIIAVATASALFEGILATFRSAYSGWIVTHEVTFPFGGNVGTEYDTVSRYTLNAEQLAGNLPDVSGACDGEVTIRQEIDEQHRKVTTWEFDIALTPDSSYGPAIDELRGIAQSNVPDSAKLVRSSTTAQTVHHLRVRAAFEFLDSDESAPMTNYQRTATISPPDDTYEEFAYPGADPIAVKRPKVFGRISDSGSATGVGSYVKPPDPISPNLERPKQIRLVDFSDVEKQTSWQYDLIDTDGSLTDDLATLAGELARPSDPETL